MYVHLKNSSSTIAEHQMQRGYKIQFEERKLLPEFHITTVMYEEEKTLQLV